MRLLHKILAGLGLFSLLAGGQVALAAPPTQAGKAQKAPKVFKLVQGRDHATLVNKFRNDMADEIEAVGKFSGKHNDTPVMHIVATDGAMIQTRIAAVEVNEHDIGGPGGEFAFHGPKAPTKFRVLIPVSAHYGLPYKNFAATNEYEVWVEDKTGNKVWGKTIKSIGFGKQESAIVRGDLVTEVEVDLPFDKSDEFKVSFTPTATSKNGYTSGREVLIRRQN